jgi:hypothetical protein
MEDELDEDDNEETALGNMAHTFTNDVVKNIDKGKRKVPAHRNNDPQLSRLPPPPTIVITLTQAAHPSKPERLE